MFVLWCQLYAISIVFLLSESNLSDFLGLGRGSQSSAGVKCKLRRGAILQELVVVSSMHTHAVGACLFRVASSLTEIYL